MNEKQTRTLLNAGCEIRMDRLSRILYSTDASLYQIEPAAVAFPATVEEAAAAVRAAAAAGLPVVPRGAGSGLAGGAVGQGLILDVARKNRTISNFDLERRWVRVGAGVVLDQLNEFLKPHGLWFGPDVATSSRATLGGMIAINSSGARAPVYGPTGDHVESAEIVLADGTVAEIGLMRHSLPELTAKAAALAASVAPAVKERIPAWLVKRWSGYAFDLAQRRPGDLTGLLSGSEGTLAVIWSATLRLCPLPKHRSLVLYFFSSVAEAMQAAVVLHDLKPAAVEHIDRQLFDQTRNRAAFKAARELLKLDEQPCEAILVAEFFDETGAQTREALRRELGVRRQACASAEEREIVWAFRRAGLSLLTGRRGAAKPVAGIEDVAVSPAALPAYVAALEEIIRPLGVEASFYGHAGSGLLHVRPVLDMHQAADIAKYRRIVEETAKLTTKFRGVFCAEHGAGIARTEFLDEHLGPELAAAGRELKKLFDPRNVLNPGKLVANGAYRVDENLRFGAGYAIQTPQAPVLPAFVKKDGSFTANLEQCNGCGGCLKSPATMCPTFQATGDELMSPRGRANVIRAALDGRLRDLHSPLSSEELDAALSNCLSCRACVVECPSNVDIALLKAALLCAQHAETGPPLRARLIAAADLLGRLGTTFPRLAGATLRNPLFRKLLERVAGFTTARPLPTYAAERFDRWFHKQAFARERAKTTRGQVVLWDDTFTRYHETHIGRAAVKVLQAAGYEVLLPEGRKCCGRPAFSAGLLDEAVKLGRHNVPLLKRTGALPIIFLEPSCLTMVAEDYLELEIPEAASVAKRCVSFERFVGDLLEKEPHAIAFDATQKQTIAVHVHCHAKAVGEAGLTAKLLAHLPGATVRTLATGCCGMAGAFGMFKEKYELSRKVAEPLVRQIQALPAGTILAAAGTSCRQQIAHLTDIQPKHTAEILAERIT